MKERDVSMDKSIRRRKKVALAVSFSRILGFLLSLGSHGKLMTGGYRDSGIVSPRPESLSSMAT